MTRGTAYLGLRLIILTLLAACGSYTHAQNACALLQSFANSPTNAAGALTDCLQHLPTGAELSLRPGVYRLTSPILIDRPVTITTAGITSDAAGCADLAGRCATLVVDVPPRAGARAMPVEVRSDGVTFDHLVVQGGGSTAERNSACLNPAFRPNSGGIRVSGSHFTMRKSLLRGFTCYSALEIMAAEGPTLEGNVIGPNGQHMGRLWSDGVTIHDSNHASVTDNLFVDNTDVQLIFGGCRSCTVENNRFRHSQAFSSASFAELMLQAWPSTSGDYSGTVVRGNSIDCGAERRCGYGIMIGSAPWYSGRMSGGSIASNDVANAMIGINIDALSGPVDVHGNVVRASGGRFPSDCGTKLWPPVNVGPTSRGFLHGDPAQAGEGSVSTAHCLLNRLGRPG
jgi:hypothetical protein